MSDNRQTLALDDASLPFYRYYTPQGWVVEFDSVGCKCPVPLVNALIGLQYIAATNETLRMINAIEPEGLYEKIDGCFSWTVEPLSAKRVAISFKAIPEQVQRMDFSDRVCGGKS